MELTPAAAGSKFVMLPSANDSLMGVWFRSHSNDRLTPDDNALDAPNFQPTRQPNECFMYDVSLQDYSLLQQKVRTSFEVTNQKLRDVRSRQDFFFLGISVHCRCAPWRIFRRPCDSNANCAYMQNPWLAKDYRSVAIVLKSVTLAVG